MTMSEQDEGRARAMISDLQQVAEEMGKTPTYGEYNERGEYASGAIQHVFGKWNKAIREADLQENMVRDFDPDPDEFLDLYFGEELTVREVSDEYGVGHATVSQWMDSSEIPVIKSHDCRKVIYEGSVSKEEIGYIRAQRRRSFGILDEDEEYIFDPDFALDERAVRAYLLIHE